MDLDDDEEEDGHRPPPVPPSPPRQTDRGMSSKYLFIMGH